MWYAARAGGGALDATDAIVRCQKPPLGGAGAAGGIVRAVYLLDTNIVSEPARPQPDSEVVRRLREYDGLVCMPAIVWHELLYGLARLPDGVNRRRVGSYLYDVVSPSIPVVEYDATAASIHASMRADAESRGASLGFAGGAIAGVARANNLVLVTRNTADFSVIPDLYVEDWFAG